MPTSQGGNIGSRAKETKQSIVRAGKESTIPRGDSYELLWAKDTQTLFISTPSGLIKIGGPGGVGSLAYTTILDEGVELPKRNKLNFIGDAVTAADDTTNQRTNVTVTAYGQIQSNGTNVTPQRYKLNFVGDAVTASDDAANQRTNVVVQAYTQIRKSDDTNLTKRGTLKFSSAFSVSDDSTNQLTLVDLTSDSTTQRVEVAKNGTLIATRKRLNFIEGSNVTLTIADDTTNNKVDVTVSTSASATDEKVKADSTDPTAGYLSDKVQKSITVDTTAHKLQLVNDQDSPGANKVYGTDESGTKGWISLTPAPDEKVKATSSDSTPGYLDSKTQNSITVDTTNQKLQLVNDVATVTEGYCYGRRTGDTDRGWVPMPLFESTDLVSLNVAVDITATSSPGQIVDSTSPNPAFQLVLPPGKHMVVINLESTLRASTGTSSGTAQIIVGVYKREGTTETLIVNRRAVFSNMTANTTMNASEFNSGGAPVFVTTTYSGTSTDIRGNNVTGTVIFIRAYRSNTTGVTVQLAQLQSTTTIQSARIT